MTPIEKCCCFTGYRPEKFGFKFDENDKRYRELTARIVTSVSVMLGGGVCEFYTGMAMGFDIIAAEYIALIKNKKKDIRLVAAVPFKGQEQRYPEDWKKRYYGLLERCDETVTLNDKYEKWAFGQRNRYMVDRCLNVITYFDGKSGGTQNTLNYARRLGRNIVNIYEADPMDGGSEYKAYFKLLPPEP